MATGMSRRQLGNDRFPIMTSLARRGNQPSGIDISNIIAESTSTRSSRHRSRRSNGYVDSSKIKLEGSDADEASPSADASDEADDWGVRQPQRVRENADAGQLVSLENPGQNGTLPLTSDNTVTAQDVIMEGIDLSDARMLDSLRPYREQRLQVAMRTVEGHTGPVVTVKLSSLLGGTLESRLAYLTSILRLDPPADVVPENRLSFNDLPPELRNRIYRMLFQLRRPQYVEPRHRDLQFSSQFLRTCKQVNAEASHPITSTQLTIQGSTILYGENHFVLERDANHRGQFFEPIWHDIGYSVSRIRAWKTD